MSDRFKFRMWDGFANKYFDEETDPLFENVYECMKQQIFYDSGNSLYKRLAYNHKKDGRVFEQCTGLKDKNGKLIYEGDILKNIEQRIEVIFDEQRYCFMFEYQDTKAYKPISCIDVLDDSSLEVIGNIHENADLLEKVDVAED